MYAACFLCATAAFLAPPAQWASSTALPASASTAPPASASVVLPAVRSRARSAQLLFGIGKRKKEGAAAGAPAVAAPPAAASLISRADELHASNDAAGVFELLSSADSSDDEVAWRQARAHHDLAEESVGDAARREQLLRDGLAIAEAAKGSGSGPSLKWHAILLGRLGDYQPTKEKVAASFKVKEGLEAAAALLAEDASIQTALGQWCFKVAGISWVERNAAKLLFGTPPESTYEEALSFLERSYAIRPTKKASLLSSQAHAKLKHAERSAEWARACLELPSAGAADAEIDAAARKLA